MDCEYSVDKLISKKKDVYQQYKKSCEKNSYNGKLKEGSTESFYYLAQLDLLRDMTKDLPKELSTQFDFQRFI